MSASLAQLKKYRVLWAQICEERGWCHLGKAQLEAKRKALHAELKLPDSSKDFTNRHMDIWIQQTAPLRNDIDIRDHSRERVVWTVTRLQEALSLVLGQEYSRGILIDWGDSVDLDSYPEINVATKLDLENLRNTLKNRLGRVIHRIRDGEMKPGPDCPNFYEWPQAHLIDCLINKRPIAPPRPLGQMRKNSHAGPVRAYCMDAEPKTFQPRREPKVEIPF